MLQRNNGFSAVILSLVVSVGLLVAGCAVSPDPAVLDAELDKKNQEISKLQGEIKEKDKELGQVADIREDLEKLTGQLWKMCPGESEIQLKGLPDPEGFGKKLEAEATRQLQSAKEQLKKHEEYVKSGGTKGKKLIPEDKRKAESRVKLWKEFNLSVDKGEIRYTWENRLTAGELDMANTTITDVADKRRVNLGNFPVWPECKATPGGLGYASVTGKARAETGHKTTIAFTLTLNDLGLNSRVWLGFLPRGPIGESLRKKLATLAGSKDPTGEAGIDVGETGTYTVPVKEIIEGSPAELKDETVYVMIGRKDTVEVANVKRELKVVQYRKFDITPVTAQPSDKSLDDSTRQPACPPKGIADANVAEFFGKALGKWLGKEEKCK